MSKRFYNQRLGTWSRGGVLGSLRMVLWVSLITMLVWVYADMEFTRDREFRVTIRLTTGSSSTLVIVADNKIQPSHEEQVVVKVAGSQSGLDAFGLKLKTKDMTLEYDLSDRPPGLTSIPSDEIVRKLAQPVQEGLTLVSVSPATLSVSLDERVTIQDVPVKFEYTGADLVSDPVITPAKVSVKIAKSQLAQLKEKPALRTVRANLQRIEGPDTELMADIDPLIEGVQVTPEPSRVKVALHVGELTQRKTFKTSVGVLMPTVWLEDDTWSKYRLVRKEPADWANLEVTVAGAKEALEKLRPEDIDAYITLKEDHKRNTPESWEFGKVTVRMSEGQNLRVDRVDPLTLEFRLERSNGLVP